MSTVDENDLEDDCKTPYITMDEDDLEDDKSVNFFMLSKEEQSRYTIPVISDPPFEIHAPRHTGSLLKDIAWHRAFEGHIAIVEYTRAFIRAQEKRGIVVARQTVELSWEQKVVEKFKDDKEKQHFLLQQLNCSLINDCWAHDNFEIKSDDLSEIEDPRGVRDETALRVLRFPRSVNHQLSTIMVLRDKEVKMDMFSRANLKASGVVVLPFLGLKVLNNIHYLDLAGQVRRSDEKPLDEAMMKAIWRGLIFNMFYFEDEELKLKKVAEEAWTSVQQPTTDVGGSASRKLEERGSPVE